MIRGVETKKQREVGSGGDRKKERERGEIRYWMIIREGLSRERRYEIRKGEIQRG